MAGPCNHLPFPQFIPVLSPSLLFSQPVSIIHHFNHSFGKTTMSFISCSFLLVHKMDQSNQLSCSLLHASCCPLLEKPSHAREFHYNFIVPSLSAIKWALYRSSSSYLQLQTLLLSSTPRPSMGSLPRWGFVVTHGKFPQPLVSCLEISIFAPPFSCTCRYYPSPIYVDITPQLWFCDSIHLEINVLKSLPTWKIPPSTFHFPLEVSCLLLLNGTKGPVDVGDYTF